MCIRSSLFLKYVIKNSNAMSSISHLVKPESEMKNENDMLIKKKYVKGTWTKMLMENVR